jgi:hypothetical protein
VLGANNIQGGAKRSGRSDDSPDQEVATVVLCLLFIDFYEFLG